MRLRADRRRSVKLPDDNEGEPVVLKDWHTPDALQIADFTLACWRQALVSNAGQDDTSDCHEAEWVSVESAAICDDDLFLRWMMISDIVTGSDVADMMMEGGVQ